MDEKEFLIELQSRCKTTELKEALQVISDRLTERIDHTILTNLMCLIVENEQDLIEEGIQ